MDPRILHGDCTELLHGDAIPENSVDLTVTSPPYDDLRSYTGDVIWNRETWEKALSGLFRVSKPGGVVVWIVGDATVKGSETGTSFKQALFAMECGFRLHDTMIWNKGTFTATGTLAVRYASVFEYMFVLSKGAPRVFNPIKDRPNKRAGDIRSGTLRERDGSMRVISGAGSKAVAVFGQRHNVWEMSSHKARGVSDHPAMFPESLAHDHIMSWSNPGDTVLDPFMGSGTTGVAAARLLRRFVGCEIAAEYITAASERINAAEHASLETMLA